MTNNQTEKHGCAEMVFSGARWDFGGHNCARNGQYQDSDSGKWYCKTHLPANVKARNEAAADRSRQEREDGAVRTAKANARASELSKKHGIKVVARPRYDNQLRVVGHDFLIMDES